MTISAGSAVSFYGQIDNAAQIVVDGATRKTLLRLVDEVKLSGTGALVLGGPQAELSGEFTLTGPKLTNMPLHAITGAGSISYQGAVGYLPRIYNLGLINANVAGQTLSVKVNPIGRMDNGGLLTSAGTGVIRGVSGTLANLGNQGHVRIDGGHLSLIGTIRNLGTLELAASPGKLSSFGVQGAVTLTGDGVLAMQPGANAAAQYIR